MTCSKQSGLSQWQRNERKQRFKALERVDSLGVSPDGMQRHNEKEESAVTVRSLFPETGNRQTVTLMKRKDLRRAKLGRK